MKNILSDYMLHRMEKKPAKINKENYGPVVTISRSYGCPAKLVAQDLAIELNKRLSGQRGSKHWKCISKEILDESAKELKVDKFMVKEAVHSYNKGVMDDLILSLGNKFYPSDEKVKKTLSDIINSFVQKGKVIIVGRAGVSLTRSVKNSFHIRLDATPDWRAQIISERQGISLVEAHRKMFEIDDKRNHLREYYEGQKPQDSIFDIIYNYQTMSEKEILESIVKIMEIKDMI